MFVFVVCFLVLCRQPLKATTSGREGEEASSAASVPFFTSPSALTAPLKATHPLPWQQPPSTAALTFGKAVSLPFETEREQVKVQTRDFSRPEKNKPEL